MLTKKINNFFIKFNWKNSDYLVIGLIFIPAIILRLYKLGSYSLWLDEAYTWWISSSSPNDFFEIIRIDGVNPPSFYIFVKLITNIFGLSEASLRMISTLSNIASIGVMMKIGEIVGNKVGKYSVGIFWAFNPMIIWYSMDARPYSLMLFLSSCLLFLFLKLKTEKKKYYWVFTWLTASIGLFTHYFFFLIILGLSLLAFIKIKDNHLFFRKWVLTMLLSIPIFIIWLYWSLSPENLSFGIGWIQTPILFDPVLTLWNMLSGYAGKSDILNTIFGVSAATFIIFAMKKRENTILFGTALILPIVSVWLISFRRPVYIDRYFIVLLPIIGLLIAKGAGQLFHRFKFSTKSQSFILLIFMTLGILTGSQIHSNVKYARENWKGLTSFIQSESSSNITIWFSDPMNLLPYIFYDKSGDFNIIHQPDPPICKEECWYILRQPYTLTHAFTQALSRANQEWIPKIPENCFMVNKWNNKTGIIAWEINCKDKN